ncbi:hypothetical protein [Kitasatospora purpeofusca]|uniref:hypothetical protein n=1 Tax=Kitasatospora purpeofusca TaxID=67352 RepID=UPI0036587A5F
MRHCVRLLLATSLTTAAMLASTDPAQAIPDKGPFVIKNLKANLCVEKARPGSGAFPESRAVRLRPCVAGAKRQQWTRTPSGALRSVEEPNQQIVRTASDRFGELVTLVAGFNPTMPDTVFTQSGKKILLTGDDFEKTTYLSALIGAGTTVVQRTKPMANSDWETPSVR